MPLNVETTVGQPSPAKAALKSSNRSPPHKSMAADGMLRVASCSNAGGTGSLAERTAPAQRALPLVRAHCSAVLH